MKEIVGDIWKFYDEGHWIVISTNGDINRFGLAVMGRGLAKEATQRIPGMAYGLAKQLQQHGNHVFPFYDIRILTFPVKHHWRDDADLELIRQSVRELGWTIGGMSEIKVVYLPRVGCGNGRREWSEVKPLLEALDDRFTVVTTPADSAAD
jgi:hypothetical protein